MEAAGIRMAPPSPLAAATGPLFSPAAAGAAVHILPPEGRPDHRPGAPDPALYLDSLHRAVPGARPALHALLRPDNLDPPVSLCKDPVRADLGTPQAAEAPLRVVAEGVLAVGVEHQTAPRRCAAPNTAARAAPRTAIPAMSGT